MNSDKAEYVNRRIGIAKRTLHEIDILIENNLWNMAVNRLYYTCFYAVTALLHNYDMDTKTHSGAQTVFVQHFIKTGIISKETGKIYTKLLGMRQNADYEDEIEYEKEEVLQLLQPTADLIAAIEAVLLKE